MPFSHPMRPYTRAEILSLNPNQNAVYGIFHGNTSVYIGQSGDLRKIMLAHIGGDNPCITRNTPDQWTALIISGDLTSLEALMIREYSPVCNQVIRASTSSLRLTRQ